MDNDFKTCNACKKDIHPEAKICHYCGSNTKTWVNFLKATGLVNIVSIFVVGISIFQCSQARIERIKAQSAAEAADSALFKANQAKAHTEELAEDFYFQDSLNKTVQKLTLANRYISRNTYVYPKLRAGKTVNINDSILLDILFTNKDERLTLDTIAKPFKYGIKLNMKELGY